MYVVARSIATKQSHGISNSVIIKRGDCFAILASLGTMARNDMLELVLG